MLKNWKLKAFVQKSISFLPFSQKINFLFQKYVTKGVLLNDDYFGLKLRHGIDHYHYSLKYLNGNKAPLIIELGTGWYPVVPILFYLLYEGKVLSIDIQDWVRKENQVLTIRKFLEWKEKNLFPPELDEVPSHKWEKLKELAEKSDELTTQDIHDAIQLECQVQNAANLDLKSDSIDFICSNNTFEHIEAPALPPILAEFKRVIKAGGFMSHFIDMTDHFAHFDSSITVYNFLKYSKRKWKRYNNSLQYLNRLRLVDYKNIYENLSIPITEEHIWDYEIKDLEKIKIHPEFANYSKEELAIAHVYLLSVVDSK